MFIRNKMLSFSLASFVGTGVTDSGSAVSTGGGPAFAPEEGAPDCGFPATVLGGVRPSHAELIGATALDESEPQ